VVQVFDVPEPYRLNVGAVAESRSGANERCEL